MEADLVTGSPEVAGRAEGISDVLTVPAEVRTAIDRARAVQAEWERVPLRDRARALRRLARVLDDRRDDIVGVIRAETGKPEVEALAEIVVSVELIGLHAGRAPGYLRSKRVSTSWMFWKKAWIERVPWGVVGAISAWNYPFILPMDCVTPAIVAGNAIVLKPSEVTPRSAQLIPDLVEQAGLPEGLVQVVTGDGRVGRGLVRGGVDRIVFTGSTGTGISIMRDAADDLTPVTLELGGKDAALVLEDADLERAAAGVVFGSFFNAGQTCLSVERVYVARPIYSSFVERVVELTQALRYGREQGTDVGPMVTDEQLAIVRRHVRDALSDGAQALAGGAEAKEGRIFPPTVLVDVDESMAVASEESFGPLLTIMAVDDDEEAVRRANASGYGLFASVWTADRERGVRIARRLRTGGASVNDVLSHYGIASLPVGGVGRSGFGKRRGLEALDEMTRVRSILTSRGLGRGEPWWYPYGDDKSRLFSALLAWRARRGLGGVAAATRRLLSRGD